VVCSVVWWWLMVEWVSGVGDDTLYIGASSTRIFPLPLGALVFSFSPYCEEVMVSPELWLAGAHNMIPLHYFDSITPSPPATDLRNPFYYLWLSENNNHRGECDRILLPSSVTTFTLISSSFSVNLSRKNSLVHRNNGAT